MVSKDKAVEAAQGKRQMTEAECKLQTIEHIEEVRRNVRWFTDKLTTRAVEHDRSKLEPPEIAAFTEHTNRLAQIEYGSEDYQRELEELEVALEHHYANNRHHPEHFEHGVSGMNLVDVVEMFCDWRAATKRNKNGNILKSIELNVQRFKMDAQLEQIFINTAIAMMIEETLR